MSTFPRFHLVFEDGSLTRVEKLIVLDGPGKGFRIEDDPQTVRTMAHQFGEVSIHDEFVPA